MTTEDVTVWAFVIAFLPGIVAIMRGHLSTPAIVLLNFVALGFIASVVGIVFGFAILLIALIWALGSNTKANRERNADAIAEAITAAVVRERSARRVGESAVESSLRL